MKVRPNSGSSMPVKSQQAQALFARRLCVKSMGKERGPMGSLTRVERIFTEATLACCFQIIEFQVIF